MQFKISSIVAALLVAQQGAAAALTAEQIVTSLDAADNVAKDATGLFDATTPHNVLNGVRGSSRMQNVAMRVTDVVDALASDPHKEGFSEADQQSICTALNEDVKIQEALLTAVTKACAAFSRTTFPVVVTESLRDLKVADDDLRSSLGGLVPACDESIKAGYYRFTHKFNKDAKIQEELLTSIGDAHGTLVYTPFTQPIAQLLRLLEGADDELHFSLVELLSTCGETVKTSYSRLNLKFDEVSSKYA